MNNPNWMDKYTDHWDKMHKVNRLGFVAITWVFVLGFTAIFTEMVLYK